LKSDERESDLKAEFALFDAVTEASLMMVARRIVLVKNVPLVVVLNFAVMLAAWSEGARLNIELYF
jgi:hypothetical protein